MTDVVSNAEYWAMTDMNGVDMDLFNLIETAMPHLLDGKIVINEALSNYYDITQKLELTEIPRKKNGYTIIQRTKEEIEKIVGKDQLWTLPAYGTWYDVGVMYNEEMTSWLSIDIDAENRFGVSSVEALSRINWSVTSQVKNFMVIVRTVAPMPPKKKMRMLIRGSKGSERGGIWSYQLSMYLMTRFEDIEISMYDPNEISYERIFSKAGRRCLVHHKAELHSEETDPSSNYDVAIDDAYVSFGGTVPWQPKCKYYSLKRHDRAAEAYLHAFEGRLFSHEIEPVIDLKCNSELCKQQCKVATSMDDLRRLRVFCVELGAEFCTHAREWSHALHKRDLIYDLVRGPVSNIDWGVYRYLEPSYPIVVEGGLAYYVEVPEKQPMPKLQTQKGWWVDNYINCLGVPKSILGGEKHKIILGEASYTVRPDVVTFCSTSLLGAGSGSQIVWCPADVRGYVRTGREHRGFFEQIVKIRADTRIVGLAPQARQLVEPEKIVSRKLKLNEWVKIEKRIKSQCTCVASHIGICGAHFFIRVETLLHKKKASEWTTGLAGRYRIEGLSLLWMGSGEAYKFTYSDYGALNEDIRSNRPFSVDVT